MNICPLCGTSGNNAIVAKDGREYSECLKCGSVFLLKDFFPEKEKEQKRYLLHNNSKDTPGYIRYLNEFIDYAILPLVPAGARILDFGSGPEPLLSKLLMGSGYAMTLYDPFFGPKMITGDNFDACILHETMEHFAHPAVELEKIVSLVRKEGFIAVRTLFRPLDMGQFLSWWYRLDSTHKIFLSDASFGYIADAFTLKMVVNNGKDIAVLKKTIEDTQEGISDCCNPV